MKGRFAPTPSGFLHLGNVFCYLLAWLYARQAGAELVLRIEDLDTQRCTVARAEALAEDLRWLGLDWDEGAYVSLEQNKYFQSCRSEIYAEFFYALEKRGLVYPCYCSRNDLHAASAPHLSDGRVLYAGTCRGLSEAQREEKAKVRRPAWRLQVEDRDIAFTDGHFGPQSYNLAKESGDFIVRRSDGVYAYQLAVVVDDALMGVTQVVRGADLLDSTAMQLYLYELLDLTPPEFIHVPLLTAPDGRRLSKRDGDLEIAALRQQGTTPEQLLGRLAYLAGQMDREESISLQELLQIFDKGKVPRDSIVV